MGEGVFKMVKVIGILGDIGSGKSFIAKQFKCPVFNADKEVNKIYKKNGLNRIFLHSHSICLSCNKEKLIKSPMPKDLEKFLKLHK